MQWYYAIDGEQAGPVEPEDIKRLVSAGTLTPEALIWNETS